MNKPKSEKKITGNETVEVLYQKMGDRWFAFSLIGDEVFVGSISQDEINALEANEAAGMDPATAAAEARRNPVYKVSGNS